MKQLRISVGESPSRARHVASALLVATLSVIGACGRPSGSSGLASDTPAQTPAFDAKRDLSCQQARVLRFRAPDLFKSGRLDRVAKILDEADQLCPAQRHETAALHIEVLVELGYWQRAEKLIAKADPLVKAQLRDLLAGFDDKKAVWQKLDLSVLLEQGRQAAARGQEAAARRGFDRALALAEQRRGQRAQLILPEGVRCPLVAYDEATDELFTRCPRQIVVYDLDLGREKRRFGAENGAIVAMTTDGSAWLEFAPDKAATARFVAAAGSRQLLSSSVPLRCDQAAAFSADGAWVACAASGDDASAVVWQTKAGQPLAAKSVPRLTAPVTVLAFSPSAKYLAQGGANGAIVVSDRSGKAWVQTNVWGFPLPGGNAAKLAARGIEWIGFVDSEKTVALAWANDEFGFYQIGKGRRDRPGRRFDPQRLAASKSTSAGEPLHFAMFRDGRSLLLARGKKLAAWDLLSRRQSAEFSPSASPINHLLTSTRADAFVLQHEDGSVSTGTLAGELHSRLAPRAATASVDIELDPPISFRLKGAVPPVSFSPSRTYQMDDEQSRCCSVEPKADPAGLRVLWRATGKTTHVQPCSGNMRSHLVFPELATVVVVCETNPGSDIRVLSSKSPALPLLATIRVMPDGRSWYAVDAEGFVELAGDVGAIRERFVCAVGALNLPFELCEDRYSNVGMISQILAGEKLYQQP